MQTLDIFLEELTDWENYTFDSIIDQMQAFEGVERDSLLRALYLFCDEIGRNLTIYDVPYKEVRRCLISCSFLPDAIDMRFMQIIDPKYYLPKVQEPAHVDEQESVIVC